MISYTYCYFNTVEFLITDIHYFHFVHRDSRQVILSVLCWRFRMDHWWQLTQNSYTLVAKKFNYS